MYLFLQYFDSAIAFKVKFCEAFVPEILTLCLTMVYIFQQSKSKLPPSPIASGNPAPLGYSGFQMPSSQLADAINNFTPVTAIRHNKYDHLHNDNKLVSRLAIMLLLLNL